MQFMVHGMEIFKRNYKNTLKDLMDVDGYVIQSFVNVSPIPYPYSLVSRRRLDMNLFT